MPQLKNNDPAKWTYNQHTRIKHEVLMRYLDSWTTILGRDHASVAYVDGFAGRGRYLPGNQPGSPLVAAEVMLDALGQAQGSGQSLGRIDFHLVEPDPDNLANLRAEIAEHPMSQHPLLRIHYYDVPFSAASAAIVSRIATSGQPGFFFLDPFGYDDPPMSVVERILGLPRCEVFINYMFDFIRWASGMSEPALRDTLDRLHGNTGWRTCESFRGTARERCLRENYREELKKRGAKYVIPFRMGADDKDRTLYYLFHASGHPKAVRTMKQAMVKAGSPGHVGYAGEARHQLRPLFDVDASTLPSLLWQLFRDRQLTYDEVIDESIELSGTCVDKDYRKVLKDMEGRGEVRVIRVTSKTARGLSGQDLIRFEQPK